MPSAPGRFHPVITTVIISQSVSYDGRTCQPRFLRFPGAGGDDAVRGSGRRCLSPTFFSSPFRSAGGAADHSPGCCELPASEPGVWSRARGANPRQSRPYGSPAARGAGHCLPQAVRLAPALRRAFHPATASRSRRCAAVSTPGSLANSSQHPGLLSAAPPALRNASCKAVGKRQARPPQSNQSAHPPLFFDFPPTAIASSVRAVLRD